MLKNYIFLIMFLLCGFIFTNFLYTFDNEPNGFRNLEWGTSIGSLDDMVLLKDSGKVKIYRKKNDNLIWENIQVDPISYYFYEGNLDVVQVIIKNLDLKNAKLLKENLSQKYGKPTELPYLFKWEGDKTKITFSYFDKDSPNPKVRELGMIQFESTKIVNKIINKQ